MDMQNQELFMNPSHIPVHASIGICLNKLQGNYCCRYKNTCSRKLIESNTINSYLEFIHVFSNLLNFSGTFQSHNEWSFGWRVDRAQANHEILKIKSTEIISRILLTKWSIRNQSHGIHCCPSRHSKTISLKIALQFFNNWFQSTL